MADTDLKRINNKHYEMNTFNVFIQNDVLIF